MTKKIPTEKLYVTVRIPCRAYVKKYIQARYGLKHTMSKHSLLGTLLFHILDKDCPKADFNPDEYDTKYEIMIPESYFKSRGYNIGYKKRHYLAMCFDKIFYEDLMLFIDLAKTHLNLNAYEAIRNFFSKYGITENDVNFDSVYKKYLRKNNTKKSA